MHSYTSLGICFKLWLLNCLKHCSWTKLIYHIICTLWIISIIGAFTLYDIDGDGTITKHEMEQILKSVYQMTGRRSSDTHIASRVNKIFMAMDADGNGELSREEFLEGAKLDKSIIDAFSLYDGLV